MADKSGLWLVAASVLTGIWANQPAVKPPVEAGAPAPSQETQRAATKAPAVQMAGIWTGEIAVSVPAGDGNANGNKPIPRFEFVAYLENTQEEGAQKAAVTAQWHSPDGKARTPVVWQQGGTMPLEVGELRAMRGSLAVAEESTGAGVFRVTACALTAADACKSFDKNLTLRVVTPARNETVLWLPLFTALGMMALGYAGSLFWSRDPIAVTERSTGFDLTESTVASLTIGTSLLGSAASLGIEAKYLAPYLTKTELAAWTILYAVGTAFGPLLFGLFKGSKIASAVSLGFLAGNFFNIFGAVGQLLLAWYLLKALVPAGIISEATGEYLCWIPIVAAVALLFYIVGQFAEARGGTVSTQNPARSFLF